MFIQLTTREGAIMLLRASRIAAVAGTDHGGSQVFLGGSLSCLVTEEPLEVVALMGPPDPEVTEPR